MSSKLLKVIVVFTLIVVVTMVASSGPAEEWTPPKNPNPQQILSEAQEDAEAKRYELALAKHIWFHEQALEVNPALYGVRLSFALSYWLDLAKKYPPAMKKLKAYRDEAEQDVLEGKQARTAFHDFASINEQLGETSKTSKLFQKLDQEQPEAARQAFDIAKSALIEAKAYKLVGKYLNPAVDFARARLLYAQNKQMAEDPRFGERHLKFANKSFTHEVTTMIAILVINDKKDAAEEIAEQARKEWDDDQFHADLDKALDGKVPKPWP